MIVILCNTNSNDKNCHGHFSKSDSKEQTPEVSGPFTRSSASVRPPPPSPGLGLCRRRSTSRAWSWAQSPGVRLGIPWHIRNIEDLRSTWGSSSHYISFMDIIWDAMRWDCSRGFKPIHRFLALLIGEIVLWSVRKWGAQVLDIPKWSIAHLSWANLEVLNCAKRIPVNRPVRNGRSHDHLKVKVRVL